jgi:AbrB family looped-hinge helix DNA binding protein
MPAVLDMAKVTSKGQVTIPASVREQIGVRKGDKVLFVREDDGRVVLYNSNMEALRAVQEAFAGAAEEAGLETEDDVVAMIKEIRRERAGA